jgi:hypothetical protein
MAIETHTLSEVATSILISEEAKHATQLRKKLICSQARIIEFSEKKKCV